MSDPSSRPVPFTEAQVPPYTPPFCAAKTPFSPYTPTTHCLQVIQADIQVGKSYIHAINRVLVPGTEGIRH